MKKFYLAFLLAASAVAQTNLTSPVTVLPTSGRAATGSLLFRDKQASYHTVGFQAPASIGANIVWQLPSADAAGCLQSNGSLVLSFASCAGALAAPSPYGTLAELQNFLLDSETIGGTNWILVNSMTATQNAATAPNNVSGNAALLTNGGIAAGATWQTVTTNSLASNYNLSVWAKSGTSNQIALGLYDLTTGTWLAGSPVTIPITAAWQRISVSGTAVSGHVLRAYLFADGNSSTGGLTNYVWGAQVDTGAAGAPFAYLRTDHVLWSSSIDPWAQIVPFAGAAVNGNLVQTNAAGSNWFAAPSTFNSQIVATAPSGAASVYSSAGWIQSNGGFVSSISGGSGAGFNSNTDGALLRGYSLAGSAIGTVTGTAAASGTTITCATTCPFPANLTGGGITFGDTLYYVQSEAGGNNSIVVTVAPPAGTFAYNTQGTVGGYVDVAPIAYSPNLGQICIDAYGNQVSQPVPISGGAFGTNDVVMWNSLTPLQGYHSPFTTGSTGSVYWQTGTACTAPIPAAGTAYGLNLNTYVFANQGFATAFPAYNAFEAFGGGMQATAFTAAGVYPAGTQLRAGFAVDSFDHTTVLDSAGRVANQYGTNLGGYMYTGFSDQNPGGPSGTCNSIAVCDNPLLTYETLAPGEISFNTALNCEVVYNGVTWDCIGGTLSTFTATGSGTTRTFQNSNGNFVVDGNGNVSGLGVGNLIGGYQVNATTIVDSSRNASFLSLTINGITAINSAGAIQSPVSGSGNAFQLVNSRWLVDGNGNMSMSGNLNTVGQYQASGNTVIDSAGIFSPALYVYATLPSFGVGKLVYCSDCQSVVGACTASGSGSMAFRDGAGTWRCF